MLRILSAVIALFAFVYPIPVQAQNSCTFDNIERVQIVSRFWRPITNITVTDAAYIREPSAWAGETFWQGYDSAMPFGDFFSLRRAFEATFYRGDEVVAMIDVRLDGARGYALLLDEGGKVPDSYGVWHGCAAIIIDLRGDITPLAWFAEGLISGN